MGLLECSTNGRKDVTCVCLDILLPLRFAGIILFLPTFHHPTALYRPGFLRMTRHEEDIAPRLVALYHESFKASLDTPESFLKTLIGNLQQIIPCHGLLMIIAPDLAATLPGDRSGSIAHIHFPRDPEPGETPKIEMEPLQSEGTTDLFEGLIAKGEEDLLKVADERYPNHTAVHKYWFRTEGEPRTAGCIFRAQTQDDQMAAFTDEELQVLRACEPHLGLCLRLHGELSRPHHRSFDFFTGICRQIASAHGLTNSEFRVLQKMVEGTSNNDICRELQISLATVKTHISHILQKTGCRNRADLIGKYFSSKQAIIR